MGLHCNGMFTISQLGQDFLAIHSYVKLAEGKQM